jgi:hypothetical protein
VVVVDLGVSDADTNGVDGDGGVGASSLGCSSDADADADADGLRALLGVLFFYCIVACAYTNSAMHRQCKCMLSEIERVCV